LSSNKSIHHHRLSGSTAIEVVKASGST
jgi:hypothetical protein